MDSLFFDELNKGRYVELTSDGTKARRQLGFCDGVVVSATHIRPGEVVAVEILETQPGWSGDLRVGFTLLSNEALLPLPSFAIPELVTRGHSWIFPVGNAASQLASHRRRAFWRKQQQRHQNRSIANSDSLINTAHVESSSMERINTQPNEDETHLVRRASSNPVSPCACCLYTQFGRVAFKWLLPTGGVYLRPPDMEKGTIVAIYYELEACSSARSHTCPTSTECFQWHPSPIFDEARMVDEPSNVSNTWGMQCRRPISIASAYQNSNRTTRICLSQDPDSNPTDPLCFQFIFHIVINGMDLITISEEVILHEEHLSPISTQSFRPPCSHMAESVIDREVTRGPMVTYFPKMRAVLDVYGQTKAVQLVPLHQEPVPRLSRLSSCAILRKLMKFHAREGPANRLNDPQPITTFANHVSSPESDTKIFSKRAKCSLFESNDPVSSPVLGVNESYPIWSNQSTFGRLANSQRCRELIATVSQLPLPPSMRRDLQRDVYAIVWRELVE
ncbi:E3 ubiquitin-protein ligase NEURL3 [Fasciola gigantica]|uniref:E3 ubiquitin-protein ligase NEURL3 n=1 Tax=Fasciola gigantica TaxID=46835 RepID=A0A504YU50_FASGI|nr:E3 ubiquitin-protein ligase NEURL3 [Fasciola gigantica]